MINDETPRHLVALAHRLVALPGWRWTSGMRSLAGWMVYDDQHGLDVVEVDTGEVDCQGPAHDVEFDDPDTLALPNLSHRCTLGAIAFELLPEAWGPHRIIRVTSQLRGDGYVEVISPETGRMVHYAGPARMAEALVESMEAAAERRVEA